MKAESTGPPRVRAGLTLLEVTTLLAAMAIVSAVLAPVLGAGASAGARVASLDNLRRLHTAQQCYAADWDDRQFTAVPDDYGAFGGSCQVYAEENGCLPPVILGWNCGPTRWYAYRLPCTDFGINGGCNNEPVILPIDFDLVVGSFRFTNARPLHDYVDGRFYAPEFYTPDDDVAYAVVEPRFALDCEYVSEGDLVPTSYALSAAGMYHPDVFRAPSRGGFQAPETLPHGYASPAFDQVRYAHLKTSLIEHNWVRDEPLECHPAYEDPIGNYAGDCQPFVFNHGADARPATLFHDGAVRFVRSGDVELADERLRRQTGDGLWSRDTPLGAAGYFGDFAIDGTNVSHHVLTTDGILGRDVLTGGKP